MVLFPNCDVTIYHLDKKTQKYSRINLESVKQLVYARSAIEDRVIKDFIKISAPVNNILFTPSCVKGFQIHNFSYFYK